MSYFIIVVANFRQLIGEGGCLGIYLEVDFSDSHLFPLCIIIGHFRAEDLVAEAPAS